MWIKFRLLSLILYCSLCFALKKQNDQKYSFAVDYDNNQFLLDGKPFRYVSGSFHYFRTPHQRWRDILRKMRAAGLNAVSTYVEWSMHQPEPDKWVWEGDANLIEFIKIAQEEDLLVILRPGPYICAERDFGGFPYWLLTLVPHIHLRTRDDRYMFYVEKYLTQVLTKVKPYLRGNGGPVIMVQIENEYGSFYACDEVYKNKTHHIFSKHVEKKAVLFTTDGPSTEMLKCGSIPDVYATVDFGSGANVKINFGMMRIFTPKGPLVNSEYYPGWLSHWGEPYQRVETDGVVKTLHEMLALNASVNFYMFYGGTNFGFTSGANINQFYWPQLTSYDYDAPLTEAGDPTPKYFKIREAISKYLPLPSLKEPTASLKKDYGVISFTPVLDLFSDESRKTFATVHEQANEPPTFESFKHPLWLVLYEAEITDLEEANNLTVSAITQDRALVYIDEKLSTFFNRMYNAYTETLPIKNGKRIKLLVENMGHVNYGNIDVEDFKGISNVVINNKTIFPYTVTGYTLASIVNEDFKVKNTIGELGTLFKGPQFLVGHFNVEGKPHDSFLNTAGWGKGAAYINGHNLGRYWPSLGPQITLFVPAEYLKEGKNTLILLELEYVPVNRTMQFQTTPILDYPSTTLQT